MGLILVTGASTGLGLNTAAELAARGEDVVVHTRNLARLPAGGWFGSVTGDLTDAAETRRVAHALNEHGRFDAVIHNAGALERRDAVMVNTIAPYLLTMTMTKPGRLIYLTSSMHRGGSTDLSRLESGNGSYSDSKLWVTALSAAFADRWPGTTSHAVDPGWVPTRMGGAGAPDDLPAGHETQVWLAIDPDVVPATGGYWYHRRTQTPDPVVRDKEFQTRLITALEHMTGVTAR